MKQQIDNQQKQSKSFLKNPYFLFVCISSISMLILLLFVSQMSVSVFFQKWTTILLNTILHLIHIKTRMSGNMILLLDGSQIKFQIIMDCTGIYPFIILASLIAGFPVKITKKLSGFMIALFYTFLFNYLRLVLLFIIGRYSAKWFEIAHIFIWQVSFVIYIVIFFFGWIQWATKKTNKSTTNK